MFSVIVGVHRCVARLGVGAGLRFVKMVCSPRRRVALAAVLGASASAAALASSEAIFTNEQLEDVAISLVEKINIGPFSLMPSRLKEAIVTKIVQAVAEAISSSDLDDAAREEIRLAASLYSDGVSAETVERVVVAVNKIVDIPIVEEEVERALIRQVVSLVLGDAGPLHLVGSTVQSGSSFVRALLQPAQRKELAARLAAAIDVPFLDEQQEIALLEKGVGVLGAALERLLPAELLRSLDGLDAAEARPPSEHGTSAGAAL
jgi:hypothetical protein